MKFIKKTLGSSQNSNKAGECGLEATQLHTEKSPNTHLSLLRAYTACTTNVVGLGD